MNKYSFDVKDFLIPSVIFAVIMLIAGIVLAIYAGSVAFKLIGASIALLGGVQLFTSASSRLNDMRNAHAVKTQTPTIKPGPKKEAEQDIAKNKYANSAKTNLENKTSENTTEKEHTPKETKSEKGQTKVEFKEEYIPKKRLTYDDTSDVPGSHDDDDDTEGVRIVGSISKRKTGTDNAGNYVKKDVNYAGGSKDQINDNVAHSSETEKRKTGTELSGERYNDTKPKTEKNNLRYKRQIITDDSLNELMKDDIRRKNMPKEELDNFLSKLLVILSSITETKTAVFAIVNEDGSSYIIESYVTSVPEKISPVQKYEIGNDLISQIIKNRTPEILKEINPNAETDLLPYYTTNTGTSSFVGIPVFFEDFLIGVLCIDSTEENAYDSSLINLLKDFKDICTGLVYNYHEKFNLVHAEKILSAIDKFTNISQRPPDEEDNIIDALIHSVASAFEFERTGICGYNEANKSWNLIAINDVEGNGDNLLGEEVDLENSMAGRAIKDHEPVFEKISDNTGKRLFDKEKPMQKGYFVSIPLRSETNNYGAFYGESKEIEHLNTYDKALLTKLAKFAALAIEKINMSEMLRSSIMIDQNSGLYNHTAFYHRMAEEMQRASDFDYDLSLLLIKIDEYASLSKFGSKVDNIKLNVIHNIETNLRIYDVFGKADQDIFGLMLIEKNKEKAKLWAEKVRNEIANSMLEINGNKVSVTVSIGIAGAEKYQKPSNLFENALNSLHKSLDKTNIVTVY